MTLLGKQSKLDPSNGRPAAVPHRLLILYAAVWGIFTVLYVLLLIPAGRIPVQTAFGDALWTLAPAAILGLAAWPLARRVPWTSSGHATVVGTQLAAALVYTSVWCGSTIWQIATFGTPGALRGFVTVALGWELLLGAMIYALIAGAAYLVQTQQRLVDQRELAVRAELFALRSQLNPHFLFNTLHSIIALLRQHPESVEEALLTFGSLLRYTLDANQDSVDDVPLEQELGCINSYIALESLRLGDRLRFTASIDPDTLECRIPVLTLQPLVENAVRHGVAAGTAKGTIHLVSTLVADRLRIDVCDDGQGADREALALGTGRGLALVRRRLEARFGSSATFCIDTAPGAGFRLQLEFPAESVSPPSPVRRSIHGRRDSVELYATGSDLAGGFDAP